MKKKRIIAMLLGTALLVCGCQQTSKATEQFLRCFGVKSLEELPELNPVQMEEFKQQAEAEVQLQLEI